MTIGADYREDGTCVFTVWAPVPKKVELSIISSKPCLVPLEKGKRGYWRVTLKNIEPGTRYKYRLNGADRWPDPASHYQPDGPHGPSSVVDHGSFSWSDSSWRSIPLRKMIMYELHVGTFTPEGTFEAIIGRLDDLKNLGINTLSLMPVSQFPGERNWGYDGTYLYGVQNSYGGPEGLKKLVDACHQKEIAVLLDVVYNHFGPEGCYLAKYGRYFTRKFKTSWGQAVNYTGSESDPVRSFVINNAIYWFDRYHIDGLRLDAIHEICDMGAKHVLGELAKNVEAFSRSRGRKFYLVAESPLNDARVIRTRDKGGFGIDGQWSDDFHHVVHTLLTGENKGYYCDYGRLEHLEKAYTEGFVYSWNYSTYRKKHYGSSSRDIPAQRFVVCSQNHDQVGNRMRGERLCHLVSFEAAKLAAGAVLLSPFVPMLFMGEEYADPSPFLYFVSHTDENLIRAVTRGRNRGYKKFRWKGEPFDPQSVKTFVTSRLTWEKRTEGKHRIMLDFYQALIALRNSVPALGNLDKNSLRVQADPATRVLLMHRQLVGSYVACVMNFSDEDRVMPMRLPEGIWMKLFDSADEQWNGPGSSLPERTDDSGKLTLPANSFTVYRKG